MNLDLHLTTACNMKCSFCGAWEYGKEKAYITEKNARSALDAGRKSGYRITTLTGGEPTIHPEFCKIVEYAHQRGYWTVVTTNGLHVTEDMVKTFRNCHTLVRISLHTLDKAKHEKLTGTDSLSDVLENISRLSENGVRTAIGCTVTPDNQNELEKLAEYAWNSGAEFIRYTPVVGIRGAEDVKTEYGFFQDILWRISKMTITNAELMEKEIKEMTFLNGIMEYMLTRKCAGGSKQHIIYDCHGTVVPCSFLPESMGLCCSRDQGREKVAGEEDPVKNIQDQIHTVQNNMSHFLDPKKGDLLQGNCHTCEFRKNCMGGCLTMKIPLGLDLIAEQPVCLLKMIREQEEKFSEEELKILYSCWCSSFLKKAGTRDKEKTCVRRLPIWELAFRRGQDRREKTWNSR